MSSSKVKHPRASDVNLILLGPNGNAVTLVYHASRGTTVSDLTITFDDDAANTLPSASTEFPQTGTPQSYKPSGLMSLTPPDPAPVPTHSTLAAAFGGMDPNGTWKLYIYDDAAGPCDDHLAEIESWTLTFTPL